MVLMTMRAPFLHAGVALGAAVQVSASGGGNARDDVPDSLAAEQHTQRR